MAFRQRRIIGDDVEGIVDPPVHRVGVVAQLVLHPAIRELPVAGHLATRRDTQFGTRLAGDAVRHVGNRTGRRHRLGHCPVASESVVADATDDTQDDNYECTDAD